MLLLWPKKGPKGSQGTRFLLTSGGHEVQCSHCDLNMQVLLAYRSLRMPDGRLEGPHLSRTNSLSAGLVASFSSPRILSHGQSRSSGHRMDAGFRCDRFLSPGCDSVLPGSPAGQICIVSVESPRPSFRQVVPVCSVGRASRSHGGSADAETADVPAC